MILQSKDKFNELALLNLDTGEVTFITKSSVSAQTSSKPVGGYSIVDGIMWSLYREDGKLYLRVGERAFEITDKIGSQLARTPITHNFQLLYGENLILEVTYTAPSLDIPLQDDPTPFIDEEDFDFPYFVHNVLSQAGRRQRVYN
jgi:hypothetical protein